MKTLALTSLLFFLSCTPNAPEVHIYSSAPEPKPVERTQMINGWKIHTLDDRGTVYTEAEGEVKGYYCSMSEQFEKQTPNVGKITVFVSGKRSFSVEESFGYTGYHRTIFAHVYPVRAPNRPYEVHICTIEGIGQERADACPKYEKEIVMLLREANGHVPGLKIN